MYFYPVKGYVDRFCYRSNPKSPIPISLFTASAAGAKKIRSSFCRPDSLFCADFLQKFPNCTKCLLYAIRENSVFCVNTLFLPFLLIFANSENGKNLLFRPDYTPCKAVFCRIFSFLHPHSRRNLLEAHPDISRQVLPVSPSARCSR